MSVKFRRAIAVFAHNEARNIIDCLDHIKAASGPGDVCYVLNNGSTDATDGLVRAYAASNDFCRLIIISIGDKANAWNVFVHELNVQADLYVFTDGDCTISRASLDALEAGLAAQPCIHAATGVPTERASSRLRQQILASGGLVGNLYALSAEFVTRLRAQHVRLPVGLIGDDSLVGSLAYWDLNPRQEWKREHVVACPAATFSYRKLSPLSLADLRLYYRRKIRYSLRHFQGQLLRAPLKAQGLSALPSHIAHLYADASVSIPLVWRGWDTWFDFLALRKIKQQRNRMRP